MTPRDRRVVTARDTPCGMHGLFAE